MSVLSVLIAVSITVVLLGVVAVAGLLVARSTSPRDGMTAAAFAALGLFLGLCIGLSASPVVGGTITAGFTLAGSLMTTYLTRKDGAGDASAPEKDNLTAPGKSNITVPVEGKVARVPWLTSTLIVSWLLPLALFLVVGLVLGITFRANDVLNFRRDLHARLLSLGFDENQASKIMSRMVDEGSVGGLMAENPAAETHAPTPTPSSPLLLALMSMPPSTALPSTPQAPAYAPPPPDGSVGGESDFWKRMDLLLRKRSAAEVLEIISQQAPLEVIEDVVFLQDIMNITKPEEIISLLKFLRPSVPDPSEYHKIFVWQDMWKRTALLSKDRQNPSPERVLEAFKREAPLPDLEQLQRLEEKLNQPNKIVEFLKRKYSPVRLREAPTNQGGHASFQKY